MVLIHIWLTVFLTAKYA